MIQSPSGIQDTIPARLLTNRDEGPVFSPLTQERCQISPRITAIRQSYRMGVDFRILPRTTISYDQFLTYFKQDNIITDNPVVSPQNFGFVLANPTPVGTPNGTPVDLGNIWSTQTPTETLPCATPIVAGTANTANPTCNAFLSYSSTGQPRNFMPTERLRFQSNYFKKFETSGSIGYSTSDYKFCNLRRS